MVASLNAIVTFIFLLTSLFVFVHGQETLIQNGNLCLNVPTFQYNGTLNITKSNRSCLRWDSSPYNNTLRPRDGADHNYCRNPNYDHRGLWCYVSFSSLVKQYCNLPKCDTDARVIWTAVNATTKSTYLYALNADPEWAHNRHANGEKIYLERYFQSFGAETQLWALTSDYESKQLFFSNYGYHYIGVFNMRTRSTTVHHDGLAYGIENMAYDRFSKNLYWVDATLKWVMVTDAAFNYYATVFRTDPEETYALTIHTTKRFLFFSTYQNFRGKVYRTDLAGGAVTVIMRYPQVDDVTGLTVDYTEDRIYWVDFVGFGSRISSSNLDGSDKRNIFYTTSGVFWSLGIFKSHIYVTDVDKKFVAGRGRYFIHIINKFNGQALKYLLRDEPRGLTIYEQNNATLRPSIYPAGECSASPPCDQICLPSLEGPRRCTCGLGYYLRNETACSTVPVSDEALIVADAGQGKIYHFPLSSGSHVNYSIIPIPTNTRISAVAVNVPERYLYWSIPLNTSILRSTFDGGNVTSVLNDRNVQAMAIDQQSGYIYLADGELNYIYVMDMDGHHLKTLYKPPPHRARRSKITSVAVDMKNKFIYWADTNLKRGRGELRRMKFDGSQDVLVSTNLTNPTSISIDLQSDRLYVGEANIPAVLEYSLTNLSLISNQDVNLNPSTTYNLSAPYRNENISLQDLKVWNGRVFIFDQNNRSLEMFDLTEGSNSIEMFGQRDFYEVTSMAIFSTSYYNNFEAVQYNPCNNGALYNGGCSQLCLAILNVTFDCDCQDGWRNNDQNMCERMGTTRIDNPPTALSCEPDKTITLEPCQTSVEVTWTAPTWVDDYTSTRNLRLTQSNITSPALLSVGSHQFQYTATDQSNNTGFCSFTFELRNLECGPRPYIQPGLGIRQSPSACSSDQNSIFFGRFIYSLSCESRDLISFGRYSNSTLINQCLPSGSWRFNNFYGIGCGASSTFPYPPSTTTSITTTTQTRAPTQTSRSTTTPNTRSTTTTPNTRSTTTPNTRSTTTPNTRSTTTPNTRSTTTPNTRSTTTPNTRSTTTPNTRSTTTPNTRSTTTPNTRSTTTLTTRSTTTLTTSSTTSSTIKSTTQPSKDKTPTTSTKGDFAVVTRNKNQIHSLTTGAVVGIVIAIVVLVVVLGVALYLKNRKASGAGSFPFFSKTKEDNAHLQDNAFDDINHYTVL